MRNSDVSFTISYDWPILLAELEKRAKAVVLVTFIVPERQDHQNMLTLGLDFYPWGEDMSAGPSEGYRHVLTVEQMYHFQHTMRDIIFEQIMRRPEVPLVP